MERASRIVGKMHMPGDTITAEELARTVWPHAVGKRIAGHTRAARLVRQRLVVEVEDMVWRKQLFALAPHIVRNLAKMLGSGMVEELEFRVVPQRREPQRAERSTATPLLDEADGIADPVLRDIYKAARKKALA
jgi:hypothetical protein